MTTPGLRRLNRATLARQGLLDPIASGDPATAITRLGSLQAQHPVWPAFALAARAADARTADLGDALERRAVVRSSLMRITIHVVAAADLWPMFTVMRPIRLDQWRLLTKVDPVDSPFGRRLSAAHEVARAALRERPRTSLELDRLMAAEAGADASSVSRPAWRQPDERVVVRAAWRHFAAFVPLVHVPFTGEGYGRSRYALAEDWLGEPMPELTLEDARVHVARRYLAAFGPASIDDLAAYVGRGRGGLGVWRVAIDALRDELVEVPGDDGRTLLDVRDAPRPDGATPAPPRLLARWDSLLLSHHLRHRDRIIDPSDRHAVFSKNADVLPTFLVDGRVAGTWEHFPENGVGRIRLTPFRPLRRTDRDALVAEAERVLGVARPDSRPVVDVRPTAGG